MLSESLVEDEVQTLVREALGDLFPKQCKDWHVRKQHINEIFCKSGGRKALLLLVVLPMPKTHCNLPFVSKS